MQTVSGLDFRQRQASGTPQKEMHRPGVNARNWNPRRTHPPDGGTNSDCPRLRQPGALLLRRALGTVNACPLDHAACDPFGNLLPCGNIARVVDAGPDPGFAGLVAERH